MEEWRYSSTILDLEEVSGQLHATAGLPAGEYPLYRRVGGPQSTPGRCGEEKNLALPGIEPSPSSP
jgi:hypothetical protein